MNLNKTASGKPGAVQFARVIGGDPTPSVIGSRAAPTRHYWPIRRRGSEAEGGPDAVGASFERRGG